MISKAMLARRSHFSFVIDSCVATPVRSVMGAAVLVSMLGGCAATEAKLPADGPSVSEVEKSPIPILAIDDVTARRVLAAQNNNSFRETMAAPSSAPSYVVGPGDSVSITVWEAPPPLLFGISSSSSSGSSGLTSPAPMVTIPDQVVAADGTIIMPFAGTIMAAGQSPAQIEREILRQLSSKANHPQVLVRVSRNVTSNVTMLGEVGASTLIPLTAKGERLLDALAMVGGVRAPVEKVSIQLSRGDKIATMPLEAVIRDPSQNVTLQPGDIVAALFQSNSFTVLGAAARNAEIDFEASGISLAQALGRIGGAQDMAADAKGVFLFRFEDPRALPNNGQHLPLTPDGKVPVIYQLDLRNPASFLVAQNFPMANHDVLYVASAPAVELQKFLNILAPTLSAAAVLITVNQ